eukprot:jgi/Mesen1/3681/ME000202S02768
MAAIGLSSRAVACQQGIIDGVWDTRLLSTRSSCPMPAGTPTERHRHRLQLQQQRDDLTSSKASVSGRRGAAALLVAPPEHHGGGHASSASRRRRSTRRSTQRAASLVVQNSSSSTLADRESPSPSATMATTTTTMTMTATAGAGTATAATTTTAPRQQPAAAEPGVNPSPSPPHASPPKALAYELVQGALVRWSEARDRSLPAPPTAVLLHGILGGGRNWGSFAKRLAQEFPTWQFLMVDLRCHGDSAALRKRGPHTVASAARDVLQLVGQLRITPRVLIGHSFGGKVAMSMVEQAAKPLARPIRVWVLDSTPDKVRAGGDGEDHPAELIAALRRMPQEVPSRRAVIDELSAQGFSIGIAQWMTTNLRPAAAAAAAAPTGGSAAGGGLSWIFDLDGVADMYKSYETTNFWPLVDNVPEGVHFDFLRAERSLHRWAHDDVTRILTAEALASDGGAGVQMHVLEDAGHWVHTDNPDGLFRILAPSFGSSGFLHS